MTWIMTWAVTIHLILAGVGCLASKGARLRFEQNQHYAQDKKLKEEKVYSFLCISSPSFSKSWLQNSVFLLRLAGLSVVRATLGKCSPMRIKGETSMVFISILFIWLCWVLVAPCRIFICGMKT